jgi:hypothetical protein
MERFVTVYEVTRHYGGPEEGGWWYNWYDALKTFKVPRAYHKLRNAVKLERWLGWVRDQFAGREHGDIYSVRGGVMIDVMGESWPRQHESRQQPHYE